MLFKSTAVTRMKRKKGRLKASIRQKAMSRFLPLLMLRKCHSVSDF
jgi:hypothetical protein